MSNEIRSIVMQIQTIRNGFEAFECNTKHSNWIRMQIPTTLMQFNPFEWKCEPFEK